MPRTLLSALAVALLAATGCAGGADPGADRPREPRPPAPAGDDGPVDTADLPEELTDQEPDWSECAPPESTQGDPAPSGTDLPGATWECATVTAPLDYRDPGGDTLDLAVIRATSRAEDDERLGSLLFNFGGPGGSGVVTLPAFGPEYAALHERYDLVSFDPRGVGESAGVVCLDDRELDAHFAADAVPRDAAQEREVRQRQAAFADRCAEASGDLLPHLGTANAARDLDLLRAVLGDERLHYFGISYGTELGAVYAHLFPRRVGRAVLDAVVDPTRTAEESALGQAEGFQRALEAYLDACVDRDDCPLGDTSEEGERRLGELLERLREDPLPTRDPDDRRLTHALAWSGLAQALYSEDFWPFLSEGLADALDDEPDGSILLTLSDALHGRNQDGSYTTLQSSLTAIRCADSDARPGPEEVRALLPRFQAVSPVFGEAMAWGLLGCADWPVSGSGPHPEVGAPRARPILLVGTTGDPATPYEGTRRMKDALNEGAGGEGEGNAVELTYEGEGHGAYHSGNRCVTAAVDGYLLEGEVPRDGTTCA